ncbi:MAG: hypothetical protein AAF518_07600, partial [Spirochaetota bacterium]
KNKITMKNFIISFILFSCTISIHAGSKAYLSCADKKRYHYHQLFVHKTQKKVLLNTKSFDFGELYKKHGLPFFTNLKLSFPKKSCRFSSYTPKQFSCSSKKAVGILLNRKKVVKRIKLRKVKVKMARNRQDLNLNILTKIRGKKKAFQFQAKFRFQGDCDLGEKNQYRTYKKR